MERIIQSDLIKRKKSPESEVASEGSWSGPRSKKEADKTSSESPKSPVDALDELIVALGQLPPSTEEVIAKLRNQVSFLIQVSYML